MCGNRLREGANNIPWCSGTYTHTLSCDTLPDTAGPCNQYYSGSDTDPYRIGGKYYKCVGTPGNCTDGLNCSSSQPYIYSIEWTPDGDDTCSPTNDYWNHSDCRTSRSGQPAHGGNCGSHGCANLTCNQETGNCE